jgi:hypothetical protein
VVVSALSGPCGAFIGGFGSFEDSAVSGRRYLVERVRDKTFFFYIAEKLGRIALARVHLGKLGCASGEAASSRARTSRKTVARESTYRVVLWPENRPGLPDCPRARARVQL